MERSRACGFKRGRAAFWCFAKMLLAPFFVWEMVKVDWMHAAALGVLVYLLGEVWWSLLLDLAGPSTGTVASKRRRGLRLLKQRVKRFYKLHRVDSRVPLRNFHVGKIKSGKHAPKLKVKAAQARKLLPFTLQLAAEFRDVHNDLAENRYQCVKYLCDIYELANKPEITEDELIVWRMTNCAFLFYYVTCGFKVYPKFHYFFHVPDHVARSGVARSFWVYSDESKNSQLKQIYEVCPTSQKICQSVLLHIEWLFQLEHLLAEL